MKGVYYFAPRKGDTRSVFEKYPDLCRNVGFEKEVESCNQLNFSQESEESA